MNFKDDKIIRLKIEDEIVYAYESDTKINKDLVKILLETTNQYKIIIKIDPNRTMMELIEFYFQSIYQPTLFKDSSIRFLAKGNLIMHDSKELIKTYIDDKNEFLAIIVDDLNDKIKNL